MIGIDISDRSVKVVQLLNDKGVNQLTAHSWHIIEPGIIERGVILEPNRLQKIILATFEQCHLDINAKDAVVASVPENQSFLRIIEVPVMSDEEINEAIKWEVAQHIPFGLENVHLDWQPVTSQHRPMAGRQEILVGAAQKKVVDPLLATLQGLKLDLAALELESQAIVRALISPELHAHQSLLIVDLGGSATNVIVYDHGAMRFTASLQQGAHNLLRDVPAADLDLLSEPHDIAIPKEAVERLAVILEPAQEELLVEIRDIINFYKDIDAEHGVEGILLTGGGANLPGLEAVILKYFDNVNIQRGNPWVNILSPGKSKHPTLSLKESVHFSTALGLALRKICI